MKLIVAMIAAAFVLSAAPAHAKYCHDKNGKLYTCAPDNDDHKDHGRTNRDCEPKG